MLFRSDLLYSGIYKGYEDHSQRWGVTEYYYNPLIAPRERSEGAYTVGRDAGRLVASTASAVLEGQVVGDTYQGERQTQAAQKGLDGYLQSQKAVARGAALVVGSYVPYYVKDSAQLQYALGADANTVKSVVLGPRAAAVAAGLELNSVLPAERVSTLYLDSDALSATKLGAIQIASTGSIVVNGALEVEPAGDITLFGPRIEVKANLTAHSGSLQLGNVLAQVTPTGKNDVTLGGRGSLSVNGGVSLDTSGLWSNQLLSVGDSSRLPYLNGGRDRKSVV